MENLLSIGDCVGVAVRQCRRDIRFLVRKLLVPSIVELFGKLFLVWGARILLVALRPGTHANLPMAIGLELLGFAICIPAEVWLTMRQLGYVRMIVLKKDSYDDAYKEVRPKFWAVIVYAIAFYICFFVWVFVWAFLFGVAAFIAKVPAMSIIMVPIILGMMLVAGVTLVVMMLPITLVFVILACEDDGVFEILFKSFKMTFKSFFPTLGFVSCSTLTWFLMYLALTSVLQVVYGIEYARLGVYTGKTMASEVQMPLYVQVFAGVWNSLIYMYLMPTFFVSAGYFYYSLRMRSEGLDLMHKLDRLVRNKLPANN